MGVELQPSADAEIGWAAPTDWAQLDLSEHSVHFYESDEFLVERISRFVGSCIAAGRSAIVIATQTHLNGLEITLEERGFALDILRRQLRLQTWDTDSALAAITDRGHIDRVRFRNAVSAMIAQAAPSAEGGPISVYGEIVAELCALGKADQAIQLEGYWNELASEHAFYLRCAYPISLFSQSADGPPLELVCAEHGQVIPTESYTELQSGEERLRNIALLQHKERVLEAELAERTRLLLAEEHARQNAESALRVRDEFISMASHELKTPVSLVKGSAQLLMRRRSRGDASDEMIDSTLAVIEQSATRLTRLINDLLAVSRLQSGELPLQVELIDLSQAVTEAVEFANAMAHGSFVFEWRQDGDSFLVNGDQNRLLSAFVNILENAMKYSRDEATVRVTLAARTQGYLLSFIDDGIGLPQGFEQAVFEPFGRAPNGKECHAGGLGLGLYITRKIVEAHGGRIWIRSRGEHRGATVKIWLPEAAIAAQVA